MKKNKDGLYNFEFERMSRKKEMKFLQFKKSKIIFEFRQRNNKFPYFGSDTKR